MRPKLSDVTPQSIRLDTRRTASNQGLRCARRPAPTARPRCSNIALIDGIYLTPIETYSYAASKSALIQLTG
jgi:hypothetical protein